MDELLGEFIAETRETLAPLAGELVAWEADPSDRARLDAIFRFVHTVKGSCGFLDLERLERLSHAAEGALAEVRDGRRTADQALVSAVLAMLDRIGAMVDALERGEDFPEGGDEALIRGLEPGGHPARAPVDEAVAGDRSSVIAEPVAAAVPRTTARSIRLPVDLLDRMMSGVSDLVLARNELSRRLRDAGADASIGASFERLSASIAEMRDAITRTRMQRIDHLFSALPRMIRDLGQELGKPMALVVEGADVELDREMIEMIRDPLTHIVRNAVDHGIERRADRLAAGKPETGRLSVTARQAGNQILIDIVDDGRGVDAERLAAKAVSAGILTAAEAQALPHARKLALMFEPGLSTASEVTSISGRGVGMDIVRANVERIGGVVEIESTPGIGTRLTLRVPLTLTIIPALTVGAAGLTFALPRSAVEEIVRLGDRGARCERVGDGTVVAVREQRLALVSLRGVLDLEPVDPPFAVVLRATGGHCFAIGVDAVHDHEELVIKPAAPAVMATGLYAGTTLPDTGLPMLLLDPAGIAAAAGLRLDQATAAPVVETRAGEAVAPALLFVDLDGAERAVRLAMVDRIEDVAADAIRETGGRLRLAHGDRLVPIAGVATLVSGRPFRVLMMSDGALDLAYPIDRVIDIVPLPTEIAAAAAPGPIAGVTLHGGRQIELIDPHWLFADIAAVAEPAARPARPLCLLADDSRWSRDILRPLVEAAGYRVALKGDDMAGDPAFVITLDEAVAPTPAGCPVLRLRPTREPRGPDDGTIWRYDRERLAAALRAAG